MPPGAYSSFSCGAADGSVQAWASYYEIPLLLNGKLVSFYSPQIAAAALRIVSFVVLYYMHWISATSVIMANTLSIVVMGVSYRIMARRWIHVPRKASKEHSREMIRFLVPLLPGTVYQALQGQISLFLIAVFGHVGQIAEVAAAGRIGQLFSDAEFIERRPYRPYFSKSPRSLFRKRYLNAMSAVTVGCPPGGCFGKVVSRRLPPSAGRELQQSNSAGATRHLRFRDWVLLRGPCGPLRLCASGSSGERIDAGDCAYVVQLVCVMLLPLSTSEGVSQDEYLHGLRALSVQIVSRHPGLLRFMPRRSRRGQSHLSMFRTGRYARVSDRAL